MMEDIQASSLKGELTAIRNRYFYGTIVSLAVDGIIPPAIMNAAKLFFLDHVLCLLSLLIRAIRLRQRFNCKQMRLKYGDATGAQPSLGRDYAYQSEPATEQSLSETVTDRRSTGPPSWTLTNLIQNQLGNVAALQLDQRRSYRVEN